ncbi:hypothetical protein B5S30_g611 [[Candida] boidinii]|nr:hypothetical protein B5S30_g611 [[Candida] boidinii]
MSTISNKPGTLGNIPTRSASNDSSNWSLESSNSQSSSTSASTSAATTPTSSKQTSKPIYDSKVFLSKDIISNNKVKMISETSTVKKNAMQPVGTTTNNKKRARNVNNEPVVSPTFNFTGMNSDQNKTNNKKAKRVKSGCFTCRKKHRKCDESKNSKMGSIKCNYCTSNELECTWPEFVGISFDNDSEAKKENKPKLINSNNFNIITVIPPQKKTTHNNYTANNGSFQAHVNNSNPSKSTINFNSVNEESNKQQIMSLPMPESPNSLQRIQALSPILQENRNNMAKSSVNDTTNNTNVNRHIYRPHPNPLNTKNLSISRLVQENDNIVNENNGLQSIQPLNSTNTQSTDDINNRDNGDDNNKTNNTTATGTNGSLSTSGSTIPRDISFSSLFGFSSNYGSPVLPPPIKLTGNISSSNLVTFNSNRLNPISNMNHNPLSYNNQQQKLDNSKTSSNLNKSQNFNQTELQQTQQHILNKQSQNPQQYDNQQPDQNQHQQLPPRDSGPRPNDQTLTVEKLQGPQDHRGQCDDNGNNINNDTAKNMIDKNNGNNTRSSNNLRALNSKNESKQYKRNDPGLSLLEPFPNFASLLQSSAEPINFNIVDYSDFWTANSDTGNHSDDGFFLDLPNTLYDFVCYNANTDQHNISNGQSNTNRTNNNNNSQSFGPYNSIDATLGTSHIINNINGSINNHNMSTNVENDNSNNDSNELINDRNLGNGNKMYTQSDQNFQQNVGQSSETRGEVFKKYFFHEDYSDFENVVLSPEEELVLLKNYVDEVGGGLDMFDPKRTFVQVIPFLMKSCATLRYAVLALSSRHLETTTTNYPENLTWKLYKSALKHLVQCKIVNNSVIAACVILCVFELSSSRPTHWKNHLEGCVNLLRDHNINGMSQNTLKRAIFWTYIRMEICYSVIHETCTLLPSQNWLPPGTPLKNAKKLFEEEGMHANYAVYLNSLVANLIYGDKEGEEFKEEWLEIWLNLKEWFVNSPSLFRCIHEYRDAKTQFPRIFFSNSQAISSNQMYHMACILLLQNKPRSIKLSTLQQLSSIDSKNISESPTNEINDPSKYIGASSKSDSTHSTNSSPAVSMNSVHSTSVAWHAKRIIGISITNSDYGAYSNSIQSLYVAGKIMTSKSEHGILLGALKKVERFTGWSTTYRCRDLIEYWNGDY